MNHKEEKHCMTSHPKKAWKKPELTSLTVQGVGNLECTTGLQRSMVCNKSAGGNIAAVSCHQNTKNTVFS